MVFLNISYLELETHVTQVLDVILSLGENNALCSWHAAAMNGSLASFVAENCQPNIVRERLL